MKLMFRMLKYAKPVSISIIIASIFGILGNLFIVAIPLMSFYLIINESANLILNILLFGSLFALLRDRKSTRLNSSH